MKNDSPLTPALSPSEGERENCRRSNGERDADDGSTTFGMTKGNQRLFPFLCRGGEDQGENSPKHSRIEPLNRSVKARERWHPCRRVLRILARRQGCRRSQVHGEFRPPTLNAHRDHEPACARPRAQQSPNFTAATESPTPLQMRRLLRPRTGALRLVPGEGERDQSPR